MDLPKTMATGIQLVETYIISISGPTASGKTTLARLLRKIFDGLNIISTNKHEPDAAISATILHQDDFYLPEDKIPLKRVPKVDAPEEYVEQADWDCPEAIDFEKLKYCLQKFRREGCRGSADHARILHEIGIEAKEETNSVGPEKVKEDELGQIQEKISKEYSSLIDGSAGTPIRGLQRRIHVLILEGFLLYFNEAPHIQEIPLLLSLIDERLLLHTTLAHALSRRQIRMTYVTIEGFFDDPPGYVENIVWPNYVKYHEHLFVDGDVGRGELSEWARSVAGIRRQEREGLEMKEVVEWGAGIVLGMIVKGL